jgi:hypothetical protein
MKKSLLLLWMMFIAVSFSSAAMATSIDQGGFGPSAVIYDFSGDTPGDTIVTDGMLTVSNGSVDGNFWDGVTSPSYGDGGDVSVITLEFESSVSAVGMNFIANDNDITLSVYNSLNVLLDSYTIDWTTLPISTQGMTGFPYGFIGLDVGGSNISSAQIDTPLEGVELYIDNIIYQAAAPVPEPATMLLLGSGLIGIAGFRRKIKSRTQQ